MLQSYTTEELLYEYYDRFERVRAEELHSEEESDKIEDGKLKQTMDWAEAEEKAELERLMAEEKAKKSEESASVVDPTSDPANREWMDKQIQEAKEVYGDSFGEDIEDNFEDN